MLEEASDLLMHFSLKAPITKKMSLQEMLQVPVQVGRWLAKPHSLGCFQKMLIEF